MKEKFDIELDEEEKQWLNIELMMKKLKEEPEFEEMIWKNTDPSNVLQVNPPIK